MAKELAIIECPRGMLSLPRRLEWLVRSLGTTQWAGVPIRYTLMSGVIFTDAERTEAKHRFAEIEQATNPNHPDRTTCSKARLLILTKLIMGYSVGNSTEEAAQAKGEMYLDAIGDMPPWAIAAAVHRWNTGKADVAGHSINYSFAPAPAVLRAICEDELAPFRETAARLARLLSAVPIDRAMDPSPIEQEDFGHMPVPHLKRIK